MCSASKAELVSSLGAQHVLDHRKDHIDGTFDLIIDSGGHSPIARLRSLTQPGGTVVLVGSEEGLCHRRGPTDPRGHAVALREPTTGDDDRHREARGSRSAGGPGALGRRRPSSRANISWKPSPMHWATLADGHAMGKVVVRVSETAEMQAHEGQRRA